MPTAASVVKYYKFNVETRVTFQTHKSKEEYRFYFKRQYMSFNGMLYLMTHCNSSDLLQRVLPLSDIFIFSGLIRGQCDSFFAPHITETETKLWRRLKNLVLQRNSSGYSWNMHDCRLHMNARLSWGSEKKNDSDKQGSKMSALLQGRAMNKFVGAQDTFAFKFNSYRSPNVWVWGEKKKWCLFYFSNPHP